MTQWFNADEDWGAGVPTVDGTTDNSPQIRAAQAAAEANGGGVIYLPAKQYEWRMSRQSPTESVGIHVLDKSNIGLLGDGPGLTRLKSLPDQNMHLVCFEGATVESKNCWVRDIELNGFRDDGSNDSGNVNSTHNLRVVGTVTGFGARDVASRFSPHYGIGVQLGTFKDMTLEKILIEDCGGDGIDFKNPNSANENIRIRDLTVRRFGRTPLNPLNPTVYAALDCRSEIDASGIRVSEFGDGIAGVAVRLRSGELGDASGLGGHKSMIRGLYVRGDGSTGSVAFNSEAKSGHLIDADVEGCDYVAKFAQFENMMTHVRAQECTNGVWYRGDLDHPTKPDRCKVSDLLFRSISGTCVAVDADEVMVEDFIFRSCGTGITTTAGSNKTQLFDGELSSVTTELVNNGTNTRVRSVLPLADMG